MIVTELDFRRNVVKQLNDLQSRRHDDNETIGELARAVNELQEDRLLTIKLVNRLVEDVHELREQVGELREGVTGQKYDLNESIGRLEYLEHNDTDTAKAIKTLHGESAELRDELHELATTVRRRQDKRLSEAAEPPVSFGQCRHCGAMAVRLFNANNPPNPTTTETRS